MTIGLLRQRNLPQVAFADEKLSKELDKRLKTNTSTKEVFPEHEFIASCLRVGLSLNDLKELTYIDCMKILLSFLGGENKEKLATQKDIDKLLG